MTISLEFNDSGWAVLDTILLQGDWSFTNIVEGYYFKLSHTLYSSMAMGWVAQAEFSSNDICIFDAKRIVPQKYSEIIILKKPDIFTNRRLALKQQSKISSDWSVKIEVSNYMPIFNIAPTQPLPLTSSNSNVASVPVSATSVLLIAANLNRIGLLIYNTSTKQTLFLGLGTAAVVNSAIAIPANSYYELPVDFTGAVNGIWAAADPAGAAKIIEFVP